MTSPYFLPQNKKSGTSSFSPRFTSGILQPSEILKIDETVHFIPIGDGEQRKKSKSDTIWVKWAITSIFHHIHKET